MATSYTTFLGLALPVTGELSGTWGDTVNNYISNYLDAAIAGAQTVTTDTTLTKTTGSSLGSTSSQYAIIIASPASANITITAPAASKIYTIINTSGTYTVKICGAGPTTGVTLGVNEKAQVAWNGSDFIKISNTGGAASFTNVTVTGTTTLSGLTASTALALDASKNVVSVTNTGTGNNVLSASPTLTGTIAGASLSLSSLTSGRVTYAGTSGLLQDSANLTFNGTTLTANTLNLTNALGTTYGGTGLTSFTANGVVYASSSSALATGSALTFDGNYFTAASGTGAFFADIVQVSGSPTKVNANGVGLELRGGTTPSVTGYNRTTSAYLPFTLDTSASIFSISGTEQMRLTSTGLGIGTSSPAAPLTIQKASSFIQVNSTGTGATYARFNNSGGPFIYAGVESSAGASVVPGTSAYSAIFGTDGAYSVQFFTNNSVRATLDSSGNLGLGVTPSAWGTNNSVRAFQNAAGGLWNFSTNYQILGQNYYYNSAGSRIYSTTAAASEYYQNAGIHAWFTAPSGTAGNAITFTQAMTLDASGNLTLGQTTSTARLTIQSGVANGTVAQFGGSSGGSDPRGLTIKTFSSNGGGDCGVDFNAAVNNTSYGAFKFSAGSATLATIDASGNLGLGVTPSAWGGTDGGAIQMGAGYTSLYSYSNAATLGSNVYYSSGANRYFASSVGASAYQQLGSVHYWLQAASGTAGNAITFTQAMTLDASGNLLVGTTSGSARLNVTKASGDLISVNTSGGGTGYVYVSGTTTGTPGYFQTSSGLAGQITCSGTTTVYAVTSDYRLKTVIGAVANSGSRIDALQPVEYTWNADGSRTRGFLAHQFQEVYAGSVSGTKDAVDSEGKPVYQAMQAATSEVIADLVAEIQSLRIRIAQLEAK